MNERVGPVIQAIRKRQGVSRPALAERVGCSYSHLANIENGKREPSQELLAKIAAELIDLSGLGFRADIRRALLGTTEAAA